MWRFRDTVDSFRAWANFGIGPAGVIGLRRLRSIKDEVVELLSGASASSLSDQPVTIRPLLDSPLLGEAGEPYENLVLKK